MTDEKKLEKEYLEKEFKDEAEKIVVSAGYDASNVLLEEDSKPSLPMPSLSKRLAKTSPADELLEMDDGDDDSWYDPPDPKSIIKPSILTPLDLDELERQVNSDYDDAPPVSTPSDRSVDEDFDDATVSPCYMKILSGAGLDTFKGFLMDMGISGNSARFRIMFPRDIGLRFIRLYQEKIPNNGGKSEAKAKKSMSKALGLTKRRKKISNIKERKTLQKLQMVGLRVIEVVLQDEGMNKTRFKSPWTKFVYDKKPYPDWKIHEATLDAGHIRHKVTNEKMVVVEVNCVV